MSLLLASNISAAAVLGYLGGLLDGLAISFSIRL